MCNMTARYWKEKQHEQTRQQLTTPKARHGHDAIPGAQVWHESACMVGKEKQETNQLKYYYETK